MSNKHYTLSKKNKSKKNRQSRKIKKNRKSKKIKKNRQSRKVKGIKFGGTNSYYPTGPPPPPSNRTGLHPLVNAHAAAAASRYDLFDLPDIIKHADTVEYPVVDPYQNISDLKRRYWDYILQNQQHNDQLKRLLSLSVPPRCPHLTQRLIDAEPRVEPPNTNSKKKRRF
jgi:hypothetical protein